MQSDKQKPSSIESDYPKCEGRLLISCLHGQIVLYGIQTLAGLYVKKSDIAACDMTKGN
jgi:hypothetical protein